jgi:hypothetical protein
VSLAVLLDALLDLPFGWFYTDAVALCRLGADVWVGGRGVGAGLLIAVQGRGEAEVVGRGVTFFEAALELGYGLFEEDALVLETL